MSKSNSQIDLDVPYVLDGWHCLPAGVDPAHPTWPLWIRVEQNSIVSAYFAHEEPVTECGRNFREHFNRIPVKKLLLDYLEKDWHVDVRDGWHSLPANPSQSSGFHTWLGLTGPGIPGRPKVYVHGGRIKAISGNISSDVDVDSPFWQVCTMGWVRGIGGLDKIKAMLLEKGERSDIGLGSVAGIVATILLGSAALKRARQPSAKKREVEKCLQVK